MGCLGAHRSLWPYLVTVELNNPEHHAKAIAVVLKDLGAVQLTSFSWLLASEWNACAILEQLRPIIDERDRLMVFELGDDLAASNVRTSPAVKWEWFFTVPDEPVN